MTTKLALVREQVGEMLAEAAELFVPEARLTFIMRVPGKPGTYLVLTDDPDLPEVSRVMLESQRVPE